MQHHICALYRRRLKKSNNECTMQYLCILCILLLLCVSITLFTIQSKPGRRGGRNDGEDGNRVKEENDEMEGGKQGVTERRGAHREVRLLCWFNSAEG